MLAVVITAAAKPGKPICPTQATHISPARPVISAAAMCQAASRQPALSRIQATQTAISMRMAHPRLPKPR